MYLKMVKMAKFVTYILSQKIEKRMELFEMEIITLSFISPSPVCLTDLGIKRD